MTAGHREGLGRSASQQVAVAELGQRALAGSEVDELFGEVVQAAVRELGVQVASLLELTRDGHLLRRAAHGLPARTIGAVQSVAESGLPGYALSTDRTVVVEDYAHEDRFEKSAIQHELQIVSAMAAPIGARGRHFGVLVASSRSQRSFSGDDVSFLQSVANVAGAAVARARADDVVRDSERHFRELANSAPALMWMTDPDGHVTFVNEGWLRFTGRTLEDELGATFASSAHPEDREQLLERWRDAMKRREELRAEYRLRRHDGEFRWVLEVGVPRWVDGDFLGYVGTATDIHERREVEDALRESEQSFRELADSAPVMIWTTDAEGLVTFVNRGWLEFTGTTLDEEVGDTWALGVHPDDVDEVLASFEAALAERGQWEREYRLRRHDGEYRWIFERGAPRYHGGRYAGYVGSSTDIHERRTMEERLREVYEREHRIAETLQRSLLPERLPQIAGLGMAARYLPAGAGEAVGGDWYDALELPDGRVALLVGDVVGHGLRAAAAMGQLRNAFRAYALVESSPAEVMARVNRLATGGPEDSVLGTALLLMLDRETGDLVYTSAGHPPPLVLGSDGVRFLEDGRSMPIGAADAAVFREGAAVLEPGSTLLLYTDGLVERRDVPLDERLRELAEVAERTNGSLEEVCDGVLSGVLGEEAGADDVALIAVRTEPVPAQRLVLTLPAEPGALVTLRRRLARFLHGTGASEMEAYEITLAISEAAGNAIEHAYGPGDASFQVEAELVGEEEVVASVRDSGSWRESREDHRGRGLKIIEGVMDSAEVTQSEEGGTTVRMRRRLAAEVPA
jgi:PAS domain S-box-containing protein